MKKINFSEPTKTHGLLLWFLVMCGYFLFIFNWIVMNNLEGTLEGQGWMSDFFKDKEPNFTTQQAINYTITAMRGVGSLLAGWVIAKLGHRKAVLIALLLLSFGLPTIFFSEIGGEAGYALFISGRMIMAIGGTVLIIFVQPIIAKFFNAKQKVVLLKVNTFAFNLGVALPLTIFLFAPIRNFLLTNWVLFSALIAGIPIILLIVYYFFAEDIKITNSSKTHQETTQNIILKPATFKSVGSEKNTWKFILFYSSFLVIAIGAILIIPHDLESLHNYYFSETNGVLESSWKNLFALMSVLGVVPGVLLITWIAYTQYSRRGFFILITSLALIFVIGAYVMVTVVSSIIPSLVFMFLAGTCLWGIQGAMLHVPHEIKTNSPQRVSIIIGYCWGIGYLVFTFVSIFLSLISDLVSDPFASWIKCGIIVFSALLMPLISCFFPKTYTTPLFRLRKKH